MIFSQILSEESGKPNVIGENHPRITLKRGLSPRNLSTEESIARIPCECILVFLSGSDTLHIRSAAKISASVNVSGVSKAWIISRVALDLCCSHAVWKWGVDGRRVSAANARRAYRSTGVAILKPYSAENRSATAVIVDCSRVYKYCNSWASSPEITLSIAVGSCRDTGCCNLVIVFGPPTLIHGAVICRDWQYVQRSSSDS